MSQLESIIDVIKSQPCCFIISEEGDYDRCNIITPRITLSFDLTDRYEVSVYGDVILKMNHGSINFTKKLKVKSREHDSLVGLFSKVQSGEISRLNEGFICGSTKYMKEHQI